MNLPTREKCFDILRKHNIPKNIIEHTKAVCEVALKIAERIEKKEVKVNKPLIIAGSLLHDIGKLNGNHAVAGAEILRELGYSEVASITERHALMDFTKEESKRFVPKTKEEKIVFYADKRINDDKVVSLQERYEYLRNKYKRDNKELGLEFTKQIEEELLGNDINIE